VNIWGTKPEDGGHSSGHTVAAIVGMVFVEFMDPNFGYIRVRKDEFQKRFNAHMSRYYRDLDGDWRVENIAIPT
jgi:hypothetical protein